MFLFEGIKEQDVQDLPPYIREIYAAMFSLFAAVNPDKIDRGSRIEIVPEGREHALRLFLRPREEGVAPLELHVSRTDCVLGLFHVDHFECRGTAAQESERIKAHVIETVKNYLEGVTVIEYSFPGGRVFKREYFLGSDARVLAGTEILSLFSSILAVFRPAKQTARKFTCILCE